MPGSMVMWATLQPGGQSARLDWPGPAAIGLKGKVNPTRYQLARAPQQANAERTAELHA